MGKVDCLRNIVEPFASLLWALGIVYLPTPDPARQPGILLHRRTQSMSLYGQSWFNSQRRRVAPPPLSYLGMLYFCEGEVDMQVRIQC